MRILVFLILVAGLIGLQGCRTGGKVFPKSEKRVHKQSSIDKEKERVKEGRKFISDLVIGVMDTSINH